MATGQEFMSIAIRQIDRISIGPAQARHDLQCWILVCLLSVTPPPVMGGGNPIYLRAQHITVDQRKGISTYRGKVRLTRGELSFTATKATVKQRNNKITIVKAYGNPVIVKKYNSQKNIMTIVSGQQLTYLAKPDRAIITGKVITRQGSAVMSLLSSTREPASTLIRPTIR